MDFFTTMLSAANIPPPKDRPIDGIDLLPFFTEDFPYDEMQLGPHGESGFPLYCGGQLTAYRVGRYKAHYKTPTWEEGLEFCPKDRFILCACGNTYHDPPLIYDIFEDPGELQPLSIDTKDYQKALQLITEAKNHHESTLKGDTRSFPRPAEGFSRPWLQPCCNPPFCTCEEEQPEE
uniref:Sulfatase N-terminal domain-containing protein n=1 Tax=Paramoeba aestuarina TaxID=180227 RepID=A0A7S4P9B2_9EUKA